MNQKHWISIFIFLFLLTSGAFGASDPFFYARIDLTDPEDLFTLYELRIDISSRNGSMVEAYVDRAGFDRLSNLGFRIEKLPDQTGAAAKGYHTYDTHLTELAAFAEDYPEITDIRKLTETDTGRKVMVLKISDNPSESEPEPALLFDFNVHGDEKIAAETAFCFISELVENYATDSQIQALVDENEIFVIPMLNPDGFAADRRTNGNNIDLNRNYGFWWDYEGSTPASEKEVQAVMQLAFDENFLLAISYHSGAELVNYPLDSTSMRAPDDALFQSISAVYGEAADYPITNGWDWYQANGIAEESYYGSNGALAVIVEISTIKSPPAAQIPYYCDKNVPAMKEWIKLSRTGVRGIVTDRLTGSAVAAKIDVVDGGWPVWSDPTGGDYYRYLEEGVYSLRIGANGYLPELVENVSVSNGEATVVDVELERDPEPVFAGHKADIVVTPRPWGNYANETLPVWALSSRDDRAFSLGAYGWIVIDMGPYTPITQVDGADFTVFEDNSDGAQSYSVSVGNDWRGPFALAGTGSGTATFDLPEDLSQARYVRIEDTSGDLPASATPGADIDAIHHSVVCPPPAADFFADITTGDAPLEVAFQSEIQAETECLTGVEWNFGDGEEGDQPVQTHLYQTPGTYSVTLTAYGPGGADTETKTDYIVVTGDGPDDDDDDSGDDDDDGDFRSNDDDASESCCG